MKGIDKISENRISTWVTPERVLQTALPKAFGEDRHGMKEVCRKPRIQERRKTHRMMTTSQKTWWMGDRPEKKRLLING